MTEVPDISNIVGARLCLVEKKDFTWFFNLTERVRIATEAPWRFIKHNRIAVTSEDHGQKFGLPNLVDAADRVLSAIQNEPVQTTRIDTVTGDLFLYFSDRMFLQFLQMSGGYEAWRLFVGEQQFICTGGGKIALFNMPSKKG